MSVSGISINADKNNLPALRAKPEDGQPATDGKAKATEASASAPVAYLAAAEPKFSPKAMDAPYSGSPIRTPPRVLRIWMAPYEDTDYDLHDQRYMYVTIHTGRWVLEANQINVQSKFRQVYPLGKRDEAADEPSKSTAPLVDSNGDAVAGESAPAPTGKP